MKQLPINLLYVSFIFFLNSNCILISSAQQKQPSPIYGFGPAALQHKETDNTSTSTTIEKSLIAANPIAGPASPVKKNVTISALVDTKQHLQPIPSTASSWSHDTASIHKPEQVVKAKKVDSWDDDISSTTQSDDDTGVYRTKPTLTTLPNPPPTFLTTPRKESALDSNSDEDSIEAAVLKHSIQKPPSGIESLVNKQIGNNYQIPQQKPIPGPQSPMSEGSTWSESSTPSQKELPTKGISSLIQQQPILSQKASELTLDDSRPLSADLKRSITKSKTPTTSSSEDSDYGHDGKSSTIVKSPFQNGALASLVQTNIRPTDVTGTKTTGVENLTKIIHDVGHPSLTNQKP